jgi:hypothetical protein
MSNTMMGNSINCEVTLEALKKANPWFFWEPMRDAMGDSIGKIRDKNGHWYYFVRYENHTTVYNIDPNTLELSYRAHIGDDNTIDLDGIS